MSYQVKLTNSARRDLKSLPKSVQREIVTTHLLELANSPYTEGQPLHGEFSGYSSYHFGRRPEYRIIYTVEEDTVTVVLVGSRADVYDRLRRRLR